MATIPPLEQALAAAAASDAAEVVVDLTDVRFIGVSGINALVRAANDAHRRGKRFRVGGASAHLRELCEVLGVDSVLAVGGRSCR